ncbi:MAG: rhodanese-like domain-containing protein [Chitinophagales bacterium]
MQKLSAAETRSHLEKGTLLLDLRPAAEFVQGFAPRSIFLPLDTNAGEWLSFLDEEQKTAILITETGKEEDAFRMIRQTGLVEVPGVADMAEVFRQGQDLLIDIDAPELELDYDFDEFFLIDVRPEVAFEAAHLEDAENLPLAEISSALPDFDPQMNIYLYGESFEQACFAASLFKRDGFHKIRLCRDGFEVLKESRIPVAKPKKKPASNDFSKN